MDNTDVIIIGNDFTKTGVAETTDYVVHAHSVRGGRAVSFIMTGNMISGKTTC